MPKLDTNACFSFAWETFKKRPGFFIGITAFIFLLSAISSFLQTILQNSDGGMIGESIGFLVTLGIGLYISFGQTKVFLKAHDATNEVGFRDFWSIKGFGAYVGVSLLATIILIIGFILFIIPGIILSLVLMFATYILVDRGLTPIESIKESARITKGHRWTLFLLSLELIVLNLVGVILLVVGLLVTIPLSILVTVHAYRTLENFAKE